MNRKTTNWIGWFVVVVMFGVSHVGGAAPQPAGMPPDIIELSCNKPLRISNLYVNRSQVAIYDKFEITFDLDGRWDNPFDPTQVKVDGEFTSPSGKVLIVPGFFYQEYRRTLKGGEDSYKSVGKPMWKVRFAPTKAGEYTYQISVTNRGQTVKTEKTAFTCASVTANHGFVRVSKTNPLYFEYDDGTPFFAIANCKWWDRISDNKHGDIEGFYTKFARAGGNMTRNFLMRIGELTATSARYNDPSAPRPDRGFGKMDLDRAWRHDQALEQCEKLGICHQLAIANSTYFHTWDKRKWSMCVYSKNQGGPISQSGLEYFTNPAARENFKRVLRYFVARWAYSTAVFSWNLWNEVDFLHGYDSMRNEARQWHREMGQYLKQIDWARHVIDTNFWRINGDPHINVPELDVVSFNYYASSNFAPVVETWIKRNMSVYRKPVMFGEFNVASSYGNKAFVLPDPDFIMPHNGMWSTMMSGSAGAGMPFDGRNWHHNKKYYNYVAAVATYADSVPFCRRTWQPIVVESFRFSDATRASYYADVFIEGWHRHYRYPPGWKEREVFEIEPDGRVKNHDSMCSYLGMHGRKKIALKMDYPEAGDFVIFVPGVLLRKGDPAPPQLTASLDGRVVVQKEFAGDPKNARNTFQRYGFSVPEGPHTIEIENTGGGRLATAYELQGFVPREGPDLEVRGLQTDDIILLWLKSPKLTWLYVRMGIEPREQPAGKLVLADVPDAVG
ncbi:MAG: DUF5060 domain-containing protein, partial [Planctomycetota bacterium]|nr:DUF5060 domain-containing protein [Planctomycetota bacterium]